MYYTLKFAITHIWCYDEREGILQVCCCDSWKVELFKWMCFLLLPSVNGHLSTHIYLNVRVPIFKMFSCMMYGPILCYCFYRFLCNQLLHHCLETCDVVDCKSELMQTGWLYPIFVQFSPAAPSGKSWAFLFLWCLKTHLPVYSLGQTHRWIFAKVLKYVTTKASRAD